MSGLLRKLRTSQVGSELDQIVISDEATQNQALYGIKQAEELIEGLKEKLAEFERLEGERKAKTKLFEEAKKQIREALFETESSRMRNGLLKEADVDRGARAFARLRFLLGNPIEVWHLLFFKANRD